MSEKTNSDQHVVITGDTTSKSETKAREKDSKMVPSKPTDLATPNNNNYNISTNVDLESANVSNSPQEDGLMSNSENEISDAEIVKILQQIAASVGISNVSLVSQPPFSLISTDPGLVSSNDEPETANGRSNSDEDPNNLALNKLRITRKKKDVDWKKFLRIIDHKVESLQPSNNPDGQVSLHDHLFEAIRDSVVPFSQKSDGTQRSKRVPPHQRISPPWWTPECAEQVQYRSYAYRNYRKTSSLENCEIIIKREAETRKVIRNAKRAALLSCESSNRTIPISLILNRVKIFRDRLLNLNSLSVDEVELEVNDTK